LLRELAASFAEHEESLVHLVNAVADDTNLAAAVESIEAADMT
jgi:hypothetical protein